MNNPTQHWGWIPGIHGRVAGTALALAIMLVPAVLVTGSAQAQTCTESVLHSFTGPPDGSEPLAGLVRDVQGNLYGTTYRGGDPACNAPSGCGTVFKVDARGQETVLHTFTGGDGAQPWAGLLRDAQGNLYGTTVWGGASNYGTVFKVDTTGKETVLYSFTGGGDGAYSFGGLVQDTRGNPIGHGRNIVAYGTAVLGGAYGAGAVFKLDTTGRETVLYSFTGTGGDGANSVATLVQDARGKLNGTTEGGGAFGEGTVFEVDATGKETVLYSFTGTGGDGAVPYAGLVRDAQGNLYGTTYHGGDLRCPDGGCGTVFKVDTTGKETVLHSFTGGGDGLDPHAGLVRDAQGNLYGTTELGGGGLGCNLTFGCGTVFMLDTTGKETVLYSFTGTRGDGSQPAAGLVRDAQGNLYGTTSSGGDPAWPGGTVFKLQCIGEQ